MLVLGYSGHNRHGWDDEKAKRLSRLCHFARHQTLFDALTSFGDRIEDLPINLFPVDGVGHDAAAAILDNGRVIAAAAEERFSRLKHATTIDGKTLAPRVAVDYCLNAAGPKRTRVRHAGYYCDCPQDILKERVAAIEPYLPSSIRERVLLAYRTVFEKTVANDQIAGNFKSLVGTESEEITLHFVPHHVAHAASAFYSSGFSEAGILTFDGSGEKSSSIFAVGDQKGIRVLEEAMLPTSLGMLYMMMTAFLGFKPLSGEYKVMGLSSFGDARQFRQQFAQLLVLGEDGSYRTDALCGADFRELVRDLFGPPRCEESKLTKRDADIAASLQNAFEQAVFHQITHLKEKYGIDSLCLSGGCALNGLLTGKIARSSMFERIFISPAAGDDGCSIGAAQYVYYDVLKRKRTEQTALKSVYLGPRFSSAQILHTLEGHRDKLNYRREKRIEETIARELAAGKLVGWFQGRMEFGPRALGNRSILADPRRAEVKDTLNRCVKYRETFRPFAPAVIEEAADSLFDMKGVPRSPFMLYVVPVRDEARKRIPAVVHCDGSARVQTVSRRDNERFWSLLTEFEKCSNLPVLLNTSFNVRGEPIICNPSDAIQCFLATSLDLLAMEDILVWKKEDS